MVDEDVTEGAEEAGKKGGIVKILVFALLGILLIGITVGVTLFMTGYFDEKPALVDETGNVVAQLQAGNKSDGTAEVTEPEVLKKQPKDLPDSQKFDQTYAQLEEKFTVNLADSKKFMQFSIGYMTHYDERIVEAVTKHQIAIRSAILMQMGSLGEDDVYTVDAKLKMANGIRDSINEVLENFEDFGGVEEVYFTEFVVQ